MLHYTLIAFSLKAGNVAIPIIPLRFETLQLLLQTDQVPTASHYPQVAHDS